MNRSLRSAVALLVGAMLTIGLALAPAQNLARKPISRIPVSRNPMQQPLPDPGPAGPRLGFPGAGFPGAGIPRAGIPGIGIPTIWIPPNELLPEALGLISETGQQIDWGHAAINVPQAWRATKGAGAIVAILDTGIDTGHEDLKEQVTLSKNFTTSGTVLGIQGHGTHCAGIVAALDNSIGIVGVAPQAKLLNGKVLGDNGSGQMDWAAQGVDWAVDHGAHVISMSLGSPSAYGPLEAAINRAVSKGVIVVCAASNSGPGPNTVEYPGKYEAVICVAAFDSQMNVTNFSSRGPEVDVAAPGQQVLSLYPGGQMAVLSGTSMATPYVAGVAALYVSSCQKAGRTPSPLEFRRILQETSLSSNPVRPNPNSGYGRIQADQFVKSAPNPPPGNGGTQDVTLTESDLTAGTWKKLQEAGWTKFQFTVTMKTPPAPSLAPNTAPETQAVRSTRSFVGR